MVNDLVNMLRYTDNIQGLLEAKSVQCMELYELNRNKNVAHCAIINASGVIAAHNEKRFWHTPLKSPVLLASLQQRELTTVLDGMTYHTLIPIFGKQNMYVGTVDIGFPKGTVDEKIRQVLLNSVELFGVFLVLAVISISMLVSLLFAKPVESLMAVMEKVETENFDVKAHITTKDELGKLAEALNKMKGQLKESFQKREQLLRELQEKNKILQVEIAERRQAEKVQTALCRISEAAHTVQNLEALFPIIHDIVGELMPAKSFYIAFYDVATQMISFPYYYAADYDSIVACPSRRFGKGLTEHVLQTGQPLLASPEELKKLIRQGDIELMGVGPSHAVYWLGVPLQIHKKTTGMLAVQSITDTISFGEAEKNILVFVSTQIAMAIERVRAEEELREHRDHLEEFVKERTAELTLANERLRQEITGRKSVEEQLRESEEQYRSLFESLQDVFFRTDTEGFLLLVSPSIVQLVGYLPEEVIGKHIARTLYVAPDQWQEFQATMEKNGYTEEFEVLLKRSDGSGVWGSVASQFYTDYEGSILGFEGTIRDITERKQAEVKLQQAKETAEAANRAKSEFLANMSHEIRTPMNAILGFAELLSSGISEPQHKMYVDSIYSSGKSLLSLINDILDLSKIEAGKMELQPVPVSLRSLFQEMEQIFSFRVAQKGLAFATELHSDIPDYLLLDEVRLRQVLVNLLGNAVKFTEHGRISLRVRELNELKNSETQTLKRSNTQTLLFEVEDTGIGISPEDQEAIFAAFQQQTGQRTKDFGGTGLGLAISKRLVEIMGGTISVISEVGKGSRFEIRLSHVEVASAPAPSEPKTVIAYDRLVFDPSTILVVDDIATNRQLITEFLQDSGLTLIEAENGKEAIEQARHHHPDLILMDLKMPEMNGYEALTALRNDESTKTIPVIALTASAMKEDQEHVKHAGFDDSLLKPIERQALLETLCRFLPYSEREPEEVSEPQTEVPVEAEVLSPETLARLPELLKKLEGEMMGQWETVRQKQRIPDIEEFGRQIKALGERSALPGLVSFGEQLLQHVNNFDIEQMQRTLEAFPELITRLKSLGG